MNEAQMVFSKHGTYIDFVTKEKRTDSFNPKNRVEKRSVERNGKKYEFEFYVYDSQYCEEV